jgi:hypothetical protein
LDGKLVGECGVGPWAVPSQALVCSETTIKGSELTVLLAAPTQEFNLGTAILAECLNRTRYPGKVVVVLARHYGRASQEVDVSFIRDVLLYEPQILALSCYFWNHEENLRLARLAKHVKRDIFTVLGGPQVGTLANALELVEREPSVDAILCGEADETFPELLVQLMDGTSRHRLPGAVVRRPDGIEAGEPRLPAPDLERLPRVFYPGSRYLASFAPEGLFTIQTLRGCRNHCSYCLYALPKLRCFPLERIEEEVAFLCERGVRRVRIADSHFGGSRERAMRLFGIIQSHNRGTVFSFYPDLDHVTAEYLRAATQANCTILSLGGESLNRRIATRIGRPPHHSAVEALASLTSHGVRTQVDLMYGLPGQTAEDLASDISVLSNAGAGQILLSPLMAFPGTSLSENLATMGLSVLPTPQSFAYDSALGFDGYRRSILVAEAYGCLKVLRRAEALLRRQGSRPAYSATLSLLERRAVLELAEALRSNTGTTIRDHSLALTKAAAQVVVGIFEPAPQSEAELVELIRMDILEHAMERRSAELARDGFRIPRAPSVLFEEDLVGVRWCLHPEAWIETFAAFPNADLAVPERRAADDQLRFLFFCVSGTMWALDPADFEYLRGLEEMYARPAGTERKAPPRVLLRRWVSRGVVVPREERASCT